MKKTNILQSFKSKKFKYGGYATLMTAIVIAAVIVVNLVAGLIPLRLDLTRNKLYTLSEQTYDVLNNLDEDVTIYFVGEPGTTTPAIEEIVRRYVDNSGGRIRTDRIDPVRDPLTAQKYTKDGGSLGTGSLVVESGEVFRIIGQYDMYNFSQTSQNFELESLAVEQRLTSAILYVSGAEMSVAYQLEGHGEATLDYNTRKQMELENYELKSLNLLGLDEVPEDANIIIVNSPKRDLTKEEEEALRAYLENQGRAIFMMDLLIEDLPNFQALFSTYGIQLSNAMIIEGEPGSYIGNNPLYLLPKFGSHDITRPIDSDKLPLFIPGGQAIDTLDTVRNTIKFYPLLTTSDKAYARPADSQEMSYEKQDTDLTGPFNLAVAIEDNVYNLAANETYLTRLVVIGNSTFMNTGFEGSANLFMNSLNWVYERDESITIRPKSLKIQPIRITRTQLQIYGALALIVIPLACLASGLAVWLRRRHL
jgi:ABC-2 type transport system permease protein